ncbi:ATP-binding protein [Paraliomyxa miuraensis]|nr:ATP-binding protein [Paraliomyxa miuraensis]
MKEGDDSYRQAWQAAPMAILTLDAEGSVRSSNPGAERLFGRSRELLQGVALESCSHALDRGALRQMLGEALAGGVPPRQELRFVRADGSEVTTGFSVAPTRDPARGSDGQLVCILRDLTREQAFRPQLLHTERMASIGALASVVAHELNNALAGASGCLQLLPRPSDPGAAELFDATRSELQRAADIVKELKGYARAEDGMAERVELPGLLERLRRLQRFHHGVSEAAAALELQLDDALPVLVGNANQLLQALLNLVRNAEQATAGLPTERRVITIRARMQADVVAIEVVDRGPGVPAELRGRLFEPFFSTKPAGEGTGLGLTVVQAVAAGHGGRVEVDETPSGGATVRMVLPIGEAGLRPRAAAMPVPATAAPPGRLQGIRVLAADDEPVILRVVERACLRNGATVTCVRGTAEAEQALRDQPFDVVLLDVRMPAGGGPEVFRTIVADHPGLVRHTVFMSGDVSSAMTDVIGRGHAGVIDKPFDLDTLLDAIERALARG